MSLWKILSSPSGVEGCRESMTSAVKVNIKRADQGSSFERRGSAVSVALTNRYRVVHRTFDSGMMLFEAAPLAWPDEQRVPRIVAEYVIDQEFPGKAAVWLGEMMPDLLHDFASADEQQVKGAVGGIFLGMTSGRLRPHWEKWLREDTLELIYDVAKAHLKDRHPHLFED